MRLSINDDCDYWSKGSRATDQLLKLLKEHHDYAVPFTFVTRKRVIEIVSAPEELVPVDIGILPIAEPTLTIDGIKRVVCQHFGISHTDLVSPRRDHKVQRPRMLAMWLARELTSHGLPALGRSFCRDHTSVLHSVRKMDSMVRDGTDPLTRDAGYLREVLTA